MTLEELNKINTKQAYEWFQTACAADNWINKMIQSRPFANATTLRKSALENWWKLAEEDFLEAFEAHPMIGDVASLKAKFANTKTTASTEQQGAANASDEVLLELKNYNQKYFDKYGFIFIICATGLSAETMLNALKDRIENDRETEVQNAAEQQITITLLRLEKNLC